MKILVTGGAGFIGSHLVERLLSQGHQVNVLDDFRGGCRLPNDVAEKVDIYVGDCRDRAYLAAASTGCEFVYHLAATVGVRKVLEDPAECVENNVESLKAVLELGLPGIFGSTSEVYGKTAENLKESDALVYSSRSRWAYAASKLCGEFMARHAKWRVVRFFNVVGPRQSDTYGAVLPAFVGQALKNDPLRVYGDGSQVRTFLDVRDCAEILDILRSKDFEVVNVGGTSITNIENLARLVIKTLTSGSKQTYRTYSSAFPDGFEECARRVPDLRKLESLIGKFKFRELAETIRDLAEERKNHGKYQTQAT